jgi:hypothetical protein
LHLIEPEAATRTALLTMNVSPKADALAALDVIEHSEDGVLIERLLRTFLGVM